MSQLSRETIGAILRKVLLLERRLGEALPGEPLLPFAVNPRDPIDLQNAARTLAEHVGLTDLTFIVSIAKQASNVGGHVELRYAQSEVFIELDSALEEFPASMLAALAHEVTHKLLHEHQVWIEPTLENERLTDIAAVYAGFGAMLINGCQGERITTHGQTRTVQTFKGGYLERDELGLVYAMIERMRDQASEDAHIVLEPASMEAVGRGRDRLGRVWPRGRQKPAEVAKAVRDVVQSEQAILSAVAKDILFVRDHMLPALEAISKSSHRRLCEVLGELTELDEGRASDRVKQLLGASANLAAEVGREEIDRKSVAARAQKRLAKAVRALEAVEELPTRTPQMFRVATCAIDGTKLRIPANKRRVVVRCPACGYKFVADSTVAEPEVKTGRRWFRRR